MVDFLQSELRFAITLAKKAGDVIMEYAKSDIVIKDKGDSTQVTNADLAADQLISEEIFIHYPDDGIITEESEDNHTRLSKKRVWIVDPIDGTSNYKEYAKSDKSSKAHQYFGIHIGLAIDHEPVLGVVYAPATDELYYAVKGQGAFKSTGGGNPIKLEINDSKKSEFKISLNPQLYEELSSKSNIHFSNIGRLFGAVLGYSMVAIAENKLDVYGYFSSKYMPGEWDACAPHIILEEAGGVFTDTKGGKIIYNQKVPRYKHGLLGQSRKGVVPFS